VRAGHENRAPLRSLSPVLSGLGMEHATAAWLNGRGTGRVRTPGLRAAVVSQGAIAEQSLAGSQTGLVRSVAIARLVEGSNGGASVALGGPTRRVGEARLASRSGACLCERMAVAFVLERLGKLELTGQGRLGPCVCRRPTRG
jgi:hypothetical protein